jgi:hypothetical protein
LGESEESVRAITSDGAREEPGGWAEILNVKASSEGSLEGADEGATTADEDGVVHVNGQDVEEVGREHSKDNRVDRGLGEAEGDKQGAKEGVPSSRSFTDPVEGLVELADEASAGRRGNIIALGLFHVDVRGDVGV